MFGVQRILLIVTVHIIAYILFRISADILKWVIGKNTKQAWNLILPSLVSLSILLIAFLDWRSHINTVCVDFDYTLTL